MTFQNNDYENILNTLKELSDEKYKSFNDSLTPGSSSSYGVRIPKLREISKEILKGDWRGYLICSRDDSTEEIMLQGMVISNAKCDIEEKLRYTGEYIHKISTWALCDTFVPGLKDTAKHKERVREFLNALMSSNEEYILRFIIVMRMAYYLDDDYIDETLKIIRDINHEGYYVKMAKAWAIATSFAKQRDKTLVFLKEKKLDEFTQNKSVQKIRESYRVSKEDKEYVLALKK